MALKVGGTIVVNDSRGLENISNFKTVAGQSILGTGDISFPTSVAGYSPVTNSTGPAWGSSLVNIKADGIAEVGRYIDFHGASSDTVDSTVRLDGGAAGSTTLTLTGSFLASGNVTAYSDRRLKTDLTVIDNAIEKVKKLTGYTYTRVENGERQTGLIAQEVEQVLPEAVIQNQEYLSVAYGNLVGLLVEAIKEMSEEIAILKNKSQEV